MYQLLKTFKRNNDTREKRDAVFPFMGKIQKILFGTLDQEDGIFLQEIAEKSYIPPNKRPNSYLTLHK